MDTPIVILSPILRKVDSGLCAQSAEYGHGTWLPVFAEVFMFTVPETKPLSGNEYSPLSADPQQLPISVLRTQVSLIVADITIHLTGTVFGNSSFVSLLRRLKNWLGVVLHSRLSR